MLKYDLAFRKVGAIFIMMRIAVLPEHRFCIPAPESHRSVALLAPGAGGRGKVVSHSDGHSIVKDHSSKSP